MRMSPGYLFVGSVLLIVLGMAIDESAYRAAGCVLAWLAGSIWMADRKNN